MLIYLIPYKASLNKKHYPYYTLSLRFLILLQIDK